MRVDTLYSNRGKGKASLLNQTRDQIEFSASQTRSYFPYHSLIRVKQRLKAYYCLENRHKKMKTAMHE